MSPSRGRRPQSSRPQSSSPKRRPLQERSPSQNNARSLSRHSRPSIRIVEDDSWISQSRIYQKSALPGKPSQVFEPAYARSSSRPVSVSELASSIVSDARSSNEALILRPLQWHKSTRASGSTDFSEDDTLVNTSSTFHRQSQGSVTPTRASFHDDSILEEKYASAQVQSSAARGRHSTIRPVVSSSPATSIDRTELSDPGLVQRDASPATSIDSFRTATAHKHSDSDADSTNYEIIPSSPIRIPADSSYRGLQHASSAKKLPKPIFPPPDNASGQSLSDLSFMSSYISIDEPLSSSSLSSDQPGTIRSAIASGLAVQYPAIPSRSSSASRPSDFETRERHGSLAIPSPVIGSGDSGSTNTSSQPSTIYRVPGPVAHFDIPDQPRGTLELDHDTAATHVASPLPPSSRLSDDSVTVPAPLFQRNDRSFTPDSQELQESHDTVPELQSPHLRTVRSNRSFFSVFSGVESRPSSATESVRGSVFERGSYMESNFFPAWARSYYRRDSTSLPQSESTTSVGIPFFLSPSPNSSGIDVTIRPPTPQAASRTPSLDYVPATLYSPRKRPRQQHLGYRPPTTESVVSFVEPEIERPLPALPTAAGANLPDSPARPKGPRPPPKSAPRRAPSNVSARRSILRTPIRRTASGHFTWTPRLPHDRRSAGVLSAWPAPSLASSMGGFHKLFSRQGHRQVALFVVGFVVPFAWMLAAFLQLPPQPTDEEGGVDGQHTREQAWRSMRHSHVARLNGTSTMVEPDTGAQDDVHDPTTGVRARPATDGTGPMVDESQAGNTLAGSHNPDPQMQASFMQSWYSGELEKLELRRRYAKARWWRRLNRVMAVIGLLILGAIAALIVVALKHRF